MSEKKLHKVFPFLDWFPLINKETFRADFVAGLTGAIVGLPMGVAFAIIAGMPPIYGLYTAMVLPVIAALFGSSHHLITGPATAISIVIFSSISPFAEPFSNEFITLAFIFTIIVGVIQLMMGFMKLGSVVNFVSHTVVMGFTAGAAILIGFSQLKHVFGIKVPDGSSIWKTITYLTAHMSEFNPYILIVALSTLASAIILKAINKKIPHMLVAMIIGSVISYFLGGTDKGIILVGEMPSGLPVLSIPHTDLVTIQKLIPSAFALALLGLIEAVAIARSIAVNTHQQIDGNREFIGQGLSNFIGGFFSCFTGSGSFTRSAVNYQAGAKTPLAAIFAGVILLVVVLFIAPLTAYLPMAAMAGIILLVAYRLIDIHHIKFVLSVSKRESTVLILTFLSTLFLELEFAIYIGVIFSLIFYLRVTSKPKVVEVIPRRKARKLDFFNLKKAKDSPGIPGVKIIRIDGSLFFGAVNNVKSKLEKLTMGYNGKVLIIMSGVNLIDMAGVELLQQENKRLSSQGATLHLSNLKKQVKQYMNRTKFQEMLSNIQFHNTEDEALHDILQNVSTTGLQSADIEMINHYKELVVDI